MPSPSPADDSARLDQFSALAQRQGVAARNLVNADELNAWLQDLLNSRFGSNAEDANGVSLPPRQAACHRWLLSVARKWMIRQGQTESHQPAGDALAQSPAWVQQAIANGAPPQRLSLLPSEQETLAGVLDWMRSDDGPALSSDWTRISVDQAISSEKAWIDAMAKAALKKDLDAADAAGTTLFANSPAPGPDGKAGWRWVQVHSKEALDREGALMRHCVGSYAKDVASHRKSIFSLRDPDNKPRLTLETRQGHIAQLKAFANQPCPTDLFPRVTDFARAFESLCQAKQWTLAVSSEAQAAGLFTLPPLGLVIAGSSPPADFSIQFAQSLSEKNLASIETLPILAALGWTSLLQLALPLASADLKNKALSKAAELGHLAIVELLLPHSDPKAKDSEALSLAASNGHLPLVELLLPHSDPKANHSEALIYAAKNGHSAIAQLLLPHSDPKANDSRALREAISHGHLVIAKLLIPHSDLNADHYLPPLSLAASKGHLAMVELLLPYFDPTANNSQALSLAAHQGHLAIVELLLSYSNPKANEPQALIHAAANGHLAVARLLLPHFDPKANESQALRYAVDNGHLPVVEFLLPFSPIADQIKALEAARVSEKTEIAQLIQAAIDAHAHPQAPELACVGHKLLHERQRQSQPALTPPPIRP